MNKEQKATREAIINNGVIGEGRLNEIIEKRTTRKNGSVRIQQDFEFCPTMAEQHTGHLTDINYLMEKHQPDELAAYLTARTSHRAEITGHDFSTEPDLQEGMNVVYQSRKRFEALPEEIKRNFKNHVEFLKFIDNEANAEKMIKLGLLTKKEIKDLQIADGATTTTQVPATRTTTTQEEEDAAKASKKK